MGAQVRLLSPPTHAAAFALQATGAFTYVPLPGFVGRDTFSYMPVAGPLAGLAAAACIEVLPARGDEPPVARFSAVEVEPGVFQLTDESTDVDGAVVTWEWRLDGAALATGARARQQVAPGPHDVVLTVWDDRSLAGQARATIVAQAPGAAALAAGQDEAAGPADGPGPLDTRPTEPEAGTLAPQRPSAQLPPGDTPGATGKPPMPGPAPGEAPAQAPGRPPPSNPAASGPHLGWLAGLVLAGGAAVALALGVRRPRSGRR